MIAITGVAGFIGSALACDILAAGDVVLGIDLMPDDAADYRQRNLRVLCRERSFIFHRVDLRQPLPSDMFSHSRVVVHCAALPGVRDSWRRAAEYYAINVTSAAHVARACRDAAVPRAVNMSSSSVYGSGPCRTETSPLSPQSPYAATKLAAERVFSHLYQDVITIRPSNVYGDGQRPDMAFHRVIDAARRGTLVPVTHTGHQLRTPTYIGDCVEGIRAAIDAGTAGRVYNLAGTYDLDLQTAIHMIGRILGVQPEIGFARSGPGDPAVLTLNTDRAAAELGFVARTPPMEGLARQVASVLRTAPRPARERAVSYNSVMLTHPLEAP